MQRGEDLESESEEFIMSDSESTSGMDSTPELIPDMIIWKSWWFRFYGKSIILAHGIYEFWGVYVHLCVFTFISLTSI